MVKFLERYFKRLEFYIGVNPYPSFFFSHEDKAFTSATTWVFNRMYVSEYGAVMMLSSQRQVASIRIERVRTILVHCSVHKARNLRDYIQELARKRNEKNDTTSYEELCHKAGVVACILSSECFPYVTPGNLGRAQVIASPEECIERGEREWWRGLTLSNRPPPSRKSVHRVRYEPTLGKEQLNSELEVRLREEIEAEDKQAHKVGCSSSGGVGANGVLASRDTVLKEKGVQLLSFGRFHSFVEYESTLSVDGVDRLLIRFRCPFLIGFGYRSGGFKIVCKLRDVDRKGIRSPLWAQGRTLDFFRNSVLANAVFFCDALTSRPSLTHNTSVEVAIRNPKHVDEIGLLMKTCAKGMNLPYDDVSGRRHIPLPDNHFLGRKKRFRLTDIARKCNVDVTNQKTSLKFFQNHNESDKPFGNCSEGGDDQEAGVSSTQLSLSQERRAESIWRSTRGIQGSNRSLEANAEKRKGCFLRSATEKLEEVLSPFGTSDKFITLLKSHLHTRDSNGLAAEEISELLQAVVDCNLLFFYDTSKQVTLDSMLSLLETSNVWNEGSLDTGFGECELLTFVQKRIASVRDRIFLDDLVVDRGSNRIELDMDGADFSFLEDIRVLVAPRLSKLKDSKLTARIMNNMTELYNANSGRGRTKVLIQHKDWLADMVLQNMTLSRLMNGEDLQLLKHQMKKGLRSSSLRNMG
ncbi:hypothetical protein FGB62_152g016 [Gracilaria domingensis]|nr:hypothetical protein FGB62_152g016 [Gracilaria domingensis]